MDGRKTVLCDKHVAAGAKLVDFAGWQMPIQYPRGIVHEHLLTRRQCGLFDVSHMGRFIIRGGGCEAFLRYVLTNDAAGLAIGNSHYTILADESGGAVDDAYLYHVAPHEYLLVVNASNKEKDWAHIEEQANAFADVLMEDRSNDLAMIAVQGPQSEAVLGAIVEQGALPEPKRNMLGRIIVCGTEVIAARTGYTGEPMCFELFVDAAAAGTIWDALARQGAEPVGLGARDTLRLEASLPLYGHEFGKDRDGADIPVLACPAAKLAVNMTARRRAFIGQAAIARQVQALESYKQGDFHRLSDLPRRVRSLAVLGPGIARPGDAVLADGDVVGCVTSGTMAPYWKYRLEGERACLTDEHALRAVALALIDSRIAVGTRLAVQIRGRAVDAKVVERNLENRRGPVSYAILHT